MLGASSRYLGMNALPAEFAFDTREWHKSLMLIAGICVVGALAAGIGGGHSWRSIAVFSIALPAGAVLALTLVSIRARRRSYVISEGGVTLRNWGADVEHLSWSDIAEVRPYPLALITHDRRKIEFWLMRAEHDRLKEVLIATFNRNKGNT